MLSPDSNAFDNKLVREPDLVDRSSPMSQNEFSGRQELDFADKSQGFKGRNLFEDYNNKWNNYEAALSSPDFKHEGESHEVYTPSFDHKNDDMEFQNQSPLSFLKNLKEDVSAQKTAEPPNLRRRRNKFKQQFDETPYIGHFYMNKEGKQILHPVYSAGNRGMSLPPPMTLKANPINE